MDPRRGELWWVALDPSLGSEIAKTHPCVVLSRDVVNAHRRTVVVVPLSSSPSAFPPIRVPVTCLEKPAVAVVDQVRAVAKERLRERIGSLDVRQLDNIAAALKQILELD